MKKSEFEKKVTQLFSLSEYLIPSDSQVYEEIINRLLKPIRNLEIDKVVSIEMKGLLYGPILANKMNKPFVPIVKANKIKNRKLVKKGNPYIDYSGKEKCLEIFKGSIKKGERILLVDDWFESGNTGRSAIKLIEDLGGKVTDISVIFNQLKPKDEKFFKKRQFRYLIRSTSYNNLNRIVSFE